MYTTSLEYKDKIKRIDRLFKIDVRIKHSKGILDLTDKDIMIGSTSYSEASQTGENFTIGGAVASTFSISILNKPEYEDINFMEAIITPTVSLLLQEGISAHFIQPSQPSKMKGFSEDRWEPVLLGTFTIDVQKRQRNSIQIKSIDNMAKFDKPYKLSKLSYPATLYQIYVNACNVCDVQVGTVSFPNQNHMVEKRPAEDLTFRNIIKYVAELSGTFAKCNRMGALELMWYKDTGLTLTKSNRFDLLTSDQKVQIKGVMASTKETTYLIGSEDYAIDLTNNPLLQSNHSVVLTNIFNNIKNTIFVPFESQWQGDPAIQAGDKITQIDRDGKVHNTLVTNSTYKYRGRSSMSAKGLAEISKGAKGSPDKMLSIIKQTIGEDIGDQLKSLEQAQMNATDLLANMLGGYRITDEETGIIYIANHPDLDQATEYWKMGLGGFGHYKDGVLDTSVTADGSIVAMLVAANIITANMVQTGILQSEDGSTWINLDNGEVNIKEQLKFVNGKLTLAGVDTGNKVFNTTPTAPYALNDLWKVTGVAGVEFRICTTAREVGYALSDWTNVTDSKNYADLIKNLTTGTAIQGGTTIIDNTKVRVNHGSTSQYSEITAVGFNRKYQYGDAEYLNGIYVQEYKFDLTQRFRDPPPPIRVNLPASFRGRGSKLDILLIPTKYESFISNPLAGSGSSGAVIYSIIRELDVRVEVAVSNFNVATPYIDVNAYLGQDFAFYDASARIDYYRVNFILMVVGK